MLFSRSLFRLKEIKQSQRIFINKKNCVGHYRGPFTAPCTEDFLPDTLVCTPEYFSIFFAVCINLGRLMQHKLFNTVLTTRRQLVSHLRGMILTTATEYNLHIHHATRASSVSGASGLTNLPVSMIKSKDGQADEGYFKLDLSPYMPTAVTMCYAMTD
jgi:hypothetical protein